MSPDEQVAAFNGLIRALQPLIPDGMAIAVVMAPMRVDNAYANYYSNAVDRDAVDVLRDAIHDIDRRVRVGDVRDRG